MKKTKHSTTNYRALKPFIDATDRNEGYAKFTAPGYMDLVIEKLYYNDHEGHPVYSIAHYGTQNGDLMRDPEITFSIDTAAGMLCPLSYRNDYVGFDEEVFKTVKGKTYYSPSRLAGVDDFLYMWRKNIEDQGFRPDVQKTSA